MDSSLDLPDHESWRGLPNYSYVVAGRLTRAYRRIRLWSDRLAAFRLAEAEVASCLPGKMADPQRLRVFYVLALTTSAHEELGEALEWIDPAIELADSLGDTSAIITLLYLRGAHNSARLRFAEAQDDYDDSRGLLRALSTENRPADAALEFDLITNLSILRFYRSHFVQSEQLLDEARGLIPYLDGDRAGVDTGRIPWIEAHLFRWRGQPERALRPVLASAHAYAGGVLTPAAAGSAARIEVMAADVTLDLAETLPAGTDRDALLILAGPHVARADQLVATAGDENGAALVRLAALRLSRIRGDNLARIEPLENVARIARRLNDDALLAQTFTALGNAWSTLGESGSASSMYRQALAMLDGSDITALGVWAKRALLRESGDLPR